MTTISELVADRVESGKYQNKTEAEHSLLSEMMEHIIDSGIKEGREDVKNGRVLRLTPEGKKELFKRVLN